MLDLVRVPSARAVICFLELRIFLPLSSFLSPLRSSSPHFRASCFHQLSHSLPDVGPFLQVDANPLHVCWIALFLGCYTSLSAERHCVVLENSPDINKNERSWLISSPNMGGEVFCPKPQRATVGTCSGALEMLKPATRSRCHSPLPAEGEAGHEILEILFSKVKAGDTSRSGSPNPSACGSPPCRAGNPLIHDVHFIQTRFPPPSILVPQKSLGNPLDHDVHLFQRRIPPPSTVFPQKSPAGSSIFGSHPPLKKSSCSSFGPTPSVRIEGFASSTSDPHRGVPTYA